MWHDSKEDWEPSGAVTGSELRLPRLERAQLQTRDKQGSWSRARQEVTSTGPPPGDWGSWRNRN